RAQRVGVRDDQLIQFSARHDGRLSLHCRSAGRRGQDLDAQDGLDVGPACRTPRARAGAASVVHDHGPLTIASAIHGGRQTPVRAGDARRSSSDLNRSVCGRCAHLIKPGPRPLGYAKDQRQE
ncbi:hypothetical protein, partial [Micromonospora sp. L32]|uniref:hypothetical protein n=1 Tax=Micromonospora sp. L32 TaxID=3452214 RepID=UPI003F88C0A3